MASDWLQVSGAGPAGAPGGGSSISLAPNIPSATFAISYVANGYGPQLVIFSGVITLPTSAPNYSDLASIAVVATDPNGNQFTVATLSSPFSGSTVNYSNANGTQINQPTANQVWTSLEFDCYDPNGVLATSPYAITSGLDVNAAGLTSISFTEVGPRYADENGSTLSTFSVIPVVTNAQLPIWITLRIDYDDGNGPQQPGQYYLTTAGQAITLTHFVPTNPTQTSWIATACTGNIAQNVPFPGAFVSDSLTVAAVGACPATDITNAQLVPDANGNILEYFLSSAIGAWFWDPYQIAWTQPAFGTDPNYWFSSLTRQKGFAQTGTGVVSGGNTLTDSTNPFLLFASSPFTIQVGHAGTGYAVGDMVLLVGGTFTSPAALTVTAVGGGGAVTGLSLLYPGTYTASPSLPVSTSGGTGTGLEVRIKFINQGALGCELHINGVLTTITGYANSGVITFAPQAGIGNGSNSYEIFNPSPDAEGENEDQFGNYLGGQITDSGTLSGGESIPGTTVGWFGDSPPDWGFPPVNVPWGVYLYRTVRFRVYAWSRRGLDPTIGGTATRQMTCWTGADHFDVTPVTQPKATDLTTVNPNTTANIFFVNPSTGLFDLTPQAISTAYLGKAAVNAAQTNLAAINAATGLLAVNAAVFNLQQTSVNFISAIPTIASGGTGYVIGDTIDLTGGTFSVQAVVTVAGVSAGGVVTSVNVIQPGAYTVIPSNPVSTTGGSGSGLMLTVAWGGGALAVNNGINVFTEPMYLSQGSTAPVVALLNTGIFLYGVAGSGNTGLTTQPFVAIQSTGILAAKSATGGAVWIDGTTGSVNLYSVQTSAGVGNTAMAFTSVSAAGVVVQSATLTSGGFTGYFYQTTIGSSGINTSFTNGTATVASMTLAAAGVTLNGPVIGGAGGFAAYWYQSILTASSLTLQFTNGSLIGPSSIVLTTTGVAINQGTLVLNLNNTTTSMTNTTVGGLGVAGIQVVANSSGQFSYVVPGLFQGSNAAGTVGATVGIFGSTAGLAVANGSVNISLTANGSATILSMSNLPSSSPGAGSKQFWYDPSDGDRIKYAA